MQDPTQRKPEWVEDVFEVCALGFTVNLCKVYSKISVNRFLSFCVQFFPSLSRGAGRAPEGLLPGKLVGGVQPTSQNPYPIYDQNLLLYPVRLT